MNEKIIKLGDALMELTTTEAVELQNYLESKGLKPAQPTVVAATTATAVEEVKESAIVNVVITDKGSMSAVKMVKPLMPIIGLGAMETKKLLDAMPAIIQKGVARETGKATIAELSNEFGDEVKIELQDC